MIKKEAILSLMLLGSLTSACVPAAIVATGEVGTSIAEERSFGNIIDDATIMAKIKSDFAQKDKNNLLFRISVTVKEGRVLLTGSVPEHEVAVEAVRIAWATAGVKEVMNEIEVAQKDLKARASDSLIATQIRAKLLLQKGLSSVDYTVDVNNGCVYLVGVAQTKEEMDLAVSIASQVKGVKKVVNYVVSKDDPRRKSF